MLFCLDFGTVARPFNGARAHIKVKGEDSLGKIIYSVVRPRRMSGSRLRVRPYVHDGRRSDTIIAAETRHWGAVDQRKSPILSPSP